MTDRPDNYDSLASLTLVQLRSIRNDVGELRNDNRDIKSTLAIMRSLTVDQSDRQEELP